MTQECLFVAEVDSLTPTEWAVGPWSTDTLQGSERRQPPSRGD
jgi:hypothetical protein